MSIAETWRVRSLEDAAGYASEADPGELCDTIASRVSTTRETVSRVMSDLTRQGIVRRTKEVLILPDVNRLQEMVEEERGE